MAIVTLNDNEDNEVEDCVIDKTGSVIESTVLPYRPKEEVIEILNTDKQLESIVQYVEGSEWVVDFYTQVITENDEISRFDPNLPDTASQYLKINQLVINVIDGLTVDTAESVTGSAYINAGITPNQGDVFTATLLGGRKALLRVESVSKKNYNLNNIYVIEYNLDVFIDSDTSLVDALNDKVVKAYYYDREFLSTNSTPLLLEEKYNRKRQLNTELKEMIDYYFSIMYNKPYSILAIPHQELVIADLMMQEFIFKIIDINSNTIINKINRLTADDEYIKQPTVLDALLHRDPTILKHCNQDVVTIDLSAFNTGIRLRSIAYQGIHSIIYPLNADQTITEYSYSLEFNTGTTVKPVENPFSQHVNTEDYLIPNYEENITKYIFTEAFYNDTADKTVIESLTMQYLNNELIDTRILIKLIDDYKYWNRTQQFFLIPILILLTRDSINRSYSVT